MIIARQSGRRISCLSHGSFYGGTTTTALKAVSSTSYGEFKSFCTIGRRSHQQEQQQRLGNVSLGAALGGMILAFSGYKSHSWTDGDDGDEGTKGEEKEAPVDPALSYLPFVDKWKQTIGTVCPAIVSLHMNFPRAFEERSEGCSQATGFVIDMEDGIILTNRHVVGTGPVVLDALFLNGEQLEVKPVYRDPVHDFAFLKFDPKQLKYIHPEPIKLAPEKAQVGLDVRVIGNNAGEKLTISSGTLARLDRKAPDYGRNSYNDFNTFYYQCASSTTGGSSGSPVVNVDGDCIALNAGGIKGAANAFYLPLDRVQRAFNLWKARENISRGTIQATFDLKAFAELQRLGLSSALEEEYRTLLEEDRDADDMNPGMLKPVAQEPSSIGSNNRTLGLLCCTKTVPGGPAARAGLQPGDILLKANGAHITTFIQLEEILDTVMEKYFAGFDEMNKGDDQLSMQQAVSELPLVTLDIVRRGQHKTLRSCVNDLHEITPHCYFEAVGSVFHEAGYQQARNSNFEVSNAGVAVARASHSLRAAGVVEEHLIVEVNDTSTPNLMSFIVAINQLKKEARVKLKIRRPRDKKSDRIVYADLDRRWYDENLTLRNDYTGTWKQFRGEELQAFVEKCLPHSRQHPEQKGTATPVAPALVSSSAEQLYPSNVPADVLPADVCKKVANSLVEVRFMASYKIDGHSEHNFVGGGLVVDAKKGLVLVDRDTITCAFGEPKLRFGSSLDIPAAIRYLHPSFNLALLQYDPALVSHLPIETAEFISCYDRKKEPAVKKKVRDVFIGFSLILRSGLGRCLESKTGIATVVRTEQPPDPSPPKFKGTQFDRVRFPADISITGANGVYCTKEGKVLGYRACFPLNPLKNHRELWWGIPSDLITDFLQAYHRSTAEGKPVCIRELGVDFRYIGLRRGRELGCKEQALGTATAYEKKRLHPGPPVLLSVAKTWGGVSAETQLQNDDVVLEIDNEPVFSFYDVYKSVQGKESVKVKIIRNGAEAVVCVDTVDLSDTTTERFLLWQGCTLQDIHAAAVQQGVDRKKGGVYIASRKYGSPSHKFNLSPTSRILQVDSKKIRNLADFIEAVKSKRNGDTVWLKVVDLSGIENVLTLRVDLQFYPTFLVDRESEHLHLIEPEDSNANA